MDGGQRRSLVHVPMLGVILLTGVKMMNEDQICCVEIISQKYGVVKVIIKYGANHMFERRTG
jgi:hypothetical protein